MWRKPERFWRCVRIFIRWKRYSGMEISLVYGYRCFRIRYAYAVWHLVLTSRQLPSIELHSFDSLERRTQKISYFQMELVHSPAVFTLVNVNCTHGSRLREQLMRLSASENDDQSKWLHWHNYVEREQCAGAFCKNGPISLIYARFEFWVSINFLAFLSISRSPDHAERFVSDIEYGIEEKCLYSIENRISTHIITKTSQRPQFANSFLSHFFLVLKLSESD